MLTLAALLFPLGSDMGIAPAFHWTTGLLVLPAMTAIRLLPSEDKALRRGVAAGIAVLSVCAVAKFAAHCYGEDNLRSCDTALIQPHRLNVFTTPERAADYQRLLHEIELHRTSPDQALLLGGQASELFYAADMLHPSEQAVDYVWQQLVASAFSPAARQMLADWEPIQQALGHQPFNPESAEYKQFRASALQKQKAFRAKYLNHNQ
jgi:hypothetical protein